MQGFATFHAVKKYIDIDLEIRLIHNDIIVNIIKVYYIIHVISKSCQSLYIYPCVCVFLESRVLILLGSFGQKQQ